MVGVAVRLDSLEVGAEAELDHLEVGQLGQDPVVSGAASELFAPVGSGDDAVHGGSVPYEHLFV